MRYERVQDILQSDLALKSLLGPRTQAIDSRFGEKIMFSKETVEVTNAIHAEGKDAHKVSKSDVLKIAGRILKVLPTNGEVRATPPPTASAAPAEPSPVLSKKEQKPKPKPKVSPKSKPGAPSAPAPERQEQKPEPTGEAHASKPKKQAAPKPAPKTEAPKATAKPAQPVKVPKQAKLKKTEPAKPSPVSTGKPHVSVGETPDLEKGHDAAEIPESELPPEKQPLHLPASFDPKKYPHYDVQASIYSMLLSALTLSTHYERFPGVEERQRKIELLLKDYLDTCNQIKIG